MNCPVCGSKMVNTVITCGTCWWKIPAKDRQILGKLYRTNPKTVAPKLASVIAKLKTHDQPHLQGR